MIETRKKEKRMKHRKKLNDYKLDMNETREKYEIKRNRAKRNYFRKKDPC